MAIHGNYTEADHANFIANTRLRTALNIPSSATREQLVTHWGNIDNISISNSNVSNLSGLEWVTHMDGGLIAHYCYSLRNLDGLSSLISIGGSFLMTSCYTLLNLDGLSSLISIGGSVYMYYCNDLTNLDGFSSLVSVGSNFDINNSSNIIDLDGLSSLISIGGNLNMASCSNLSDITGIRTDISVSGSVQLTGTGVVTLSGIGYFPEIVFRTGYTGRDALIAANYHFLLSLYDTMYPDGRTPPGAIDRRPDSFSFNSNTSVTEDSTQDSNTITISGLGDGVSVNVIISSNRVIMIKKNTGSFVNYSSGGVSISNGDILQLRMIAPSTLSVSYEATMYIGSFSTNWVVSTAINDAPEVTGTVPADTTVEAGTTAMIGIPTDLFTDAEGHTVVLSYPDLPDFLSENNGVLSGTPALNEVGDYVVTITATDELGVSNSVQFIIHVTVPDLTAGLLALSNRISTLEMSGGQVGPAGMDGTNGQDGVNGVDGLDGDDFNGDARLTALETGDTNVANAITTLTGLLTTLQSEFDALQTKTQNFGRIRILTKYGNLYEQKEDGSWEDVHAPSLVFSNDTINYWKNSYWHWNKGWRYIPSTDPYGEL